MEHPLTKRYAPSFATKVVSVALVVSLSIPTASLFFARKAEATLPVIEAEKSNQILSTIKEWGIDGLAYSLAGLAGQKLSTVIVNKITGGGSGDTPTQVIQDFGQILMNTKTQQGDVLINQLTKKAADEASAEFSPYAKDFALKLSGSASQSVEEIAQGIPANLPDFGIKQVLGDQWKDFEKDITIGGWDGLLALGDPSNNPIGFNIQTGEELARRINARTEELKVKLTSTGVQPSKGKCDTAFKVVDNLISEPNNPGEFKFQATNYVAATPKDASGKTYDEAYKQWSQQSAEYKDWQKLNSAGINNLASGAAPCLIETIKNPIGTVQNLANTALDSGQQQLASGDEIGEIIGAMILSFVKGAINAGLQAVQADIAQRNTKPVGGPEQASSDPSKWNRTPARIVDMKAELNTAVINTGREVYYLEKALTEYDKYPQNIYALNQCIPGPKIGWYKRLDELFKSATKRLERKTNAKNEKVADKAQGILDTVTVSMETAKKETQLALLRPSLNIPGFSGMQSEIDKFADKSLERKNIYKTLLDRRAAQSNLSSIMDDIRGSMAGLYPQNFKPVLTRVEWEELPQAEKAQNYTIAADRTGQKLRYESVDQKLVPEDFTLVYYKTAAERPDDATSDDKAWDELSEAEQEQTWQAAEIDYLEIRNPGGEAISQCTDEIDNDGDGLADEVDPQCTAPHLLDNNEAGIATPLTNTQKRDRVMALTESITQLSIVWFYQWDRWNNGESIVLPESVASFKKQKDSIRQRFARVGDLLGNSATIGKAQQTFQAGLSENAKVFSLYRDCQVLRKLFFGTVAAIPNLEEQSTADEFLGMFGAGLATNTGGNINPPLVTDLITSPTYTTQYCQNLNGKNILERARTSPAYVTGPEAKACLLNLINNPQSGITFKNKEVINALTQGGSILDRDCKNNAATECNATSPEAKQYVTYTEDGDGNIVETTNNVAPGQEINRTTNSPYQVPTAFDIQTVYYLDQVGNLFCKFDAGMASYQEELKPVIRVGRPMSCYIDDGTAPSKEQWFDISKGEMMILYYPKNIDY